MPNGQRRMLSALKFNGLIFENIGGFALTAINVNHDFLQVFPLIKSEFFSSTYLSYLLKSKFINLIFFPQLTVFYKGFLGRKLLIQVLTLNMIICLRYGRQLSPPFIIIIDTIITWRKAVWWGRGLNQWNDQQACVITPMQMVGTCILYFVFL